MSLFRVNKPLSLSISSKKISASVPFDFSKFSEFGLTMEYLSSALLKEWKV